MANPLDPNEFDTTSPMGVDADIFSILPGLNDEAMPSQPPSPVTFNDGVFVPEAPIAPEVPANPTPEQIAQIEANLLASTPVAPIAPMAPIAQPLQTMAQPSDTITTTEKKIMSPEAKKALKSYEEAMQKQKDAADAEAKALLEAGVIQGEKDRQLAEKTSEVAQEFNNELSAADQEIAARQEALQTRIANFANEKPETFWGSKSEGDKIAAAVSVGLGSLGQALLGSKENVGMTLLKRNMDEFENNQKEVYNRQLKAIENQKLSIDQKMAAKNSLKLNYDAKMLAATEKVKQQWAVAMQQAKRPEIVAKAQRAVAELDAQSAEKKMSIMQSYAETRKTVATTKAISNLASKLNPDQRKAALKDASQIRAAVTKLDKNTNEIEQTLKIINNSKTPYDVRLSMSNNIIKVMQSHMEALGENERKVYSGELQSSIPPILESAVKGASYGAAASAVPSLGVGIVPAATAGAIALGGVELSQQLNTPGGFKIRPDVDAFAITAGKTLEKFKKMNARDSRVIELVEKDGLDTMQARIIADKELGVINND